MYIALFFSVLLPSVLFAESCPTLLQEADQVKTFGELRLQALRGWDKLITWTLSPKNREYILKAPLEQISFQDQLEDMQHFNQNYGYFSIHHPIVGIVTDAERDIEVTKCLLSSIHTMKDEEQRLFATDEILAKVVAYRPLKKGMTIPISTLDEKGVSLLENYVVDEVIDLWHGMPVFGLVPQRQGTSVPILLFRGTDLSLTSEKGWASILSDLDLSGPGYTTYLRGKELIRNWLQKMYNNKSPARLVGFSLGGAFVFFTMIDYYDLVSHQPNLPSVAFNPPGISEQMYTEWQKIPLQVQPPQATYVNQGDFVSQIGFFLSNVWEMALEEPMRVIQSHTILISAQSSYEMRAVDVDLENQSRR